MTPSELANKIAEEVFRTIERERAIVKAEIADAVEKVILKWKEAERVAEDATLTSSSPVFGLRPGEWKQINAPHEDVRRYIVEQTMLAAKPKALCILPAWIWPSEARVWAEKLGRSDLRLATQYNLREGAYMFRGLEFSEVVVDPSVGLSPEEAAGLESIRIYAGRAFAP